MMSVNSTIRPTDCATGVGGVAYRPRLVVVSAGTLTAILGRLATALAGRYTIERELGAGGMATVYLATDLRHGRKVAVKVLRPELAAVIGAERFLAEITTTAALAHPHILPLHDSGAADGFLYGKPERWWSDPRFSDTPGWSSRPAPPTSASSPTGSPR